MQCTISYFEIHLRYETFVVWGVWVNEELRSITGKYKSSKPRLVCHFKICKSIIRESEERYILYGVCVLILLTRMSKFDKWNAHNTYTLKRTKIFTSYFRKANESIYQQIWITISLCYKNYLRLWNNCPLIFFTVTELSFSSSKRDFGRDKISVWQKCPLVDRTVIFFETMIEVSFCAKILVRSVLFPIFY